MRPVGGTRYIVDNPGSAFCHRSQLGSKDWHRGIRSSFIWSHS